jgi:hypothetical protein
VFSSTNRSERRFATEMSVDDRATVRYTQVATAFLATGAFTFLVGGIFLLPFLLSPYAIQNDVYMGNLFLGYPFMAVGCVGAFVGVLILIMVPDLRHHALRWGSRAVLLAVLGALVVAGANWLLGGQYIGMSGNIWWPPYLTLPVVGVSLLMGVITVLAGTAWGQPHHT